MIFIITDIDTLKIDNSWCYEFKIHFSELSKALLEISNILYSKKHNIVFYDSLKKISITIGKSECNKLNFSNNLSLTTPALECLVSMILDYLNKKASINQHLDFELVDSKSSVISFTVKYYH